MRALCLFYVLKEYCHKKRAELQVVHVDHGIRDDAAHDAEYVRRLCEKSGVTFHLYKKDIPALAALWGIGSEEAGRRVRYEAFEEIRAAYGEKGKIAVITDKAIHLLDEQLLVIDKFSYVNSTLVVRCALGELQTESIKCRLFKASTYSSDAF